MLDINDETATLKREQKKLVNDVLTFAVKRLDVGDAEVSVTFVDNERIQSINKEYRGKDVPTDVISFAMEETIEDEVIVKGSVMPRMLGDIIVSIQKTREQANDFGHSFERELGFLVVHGLLHLLGYDHMNDSDEKQMFALQESLLTEFGLARTL